MEQLKKEICKAVFYTTELIVLKPEVIKATKYISDKLTVRATAKRYKDLAGCKHRAKGKYAKTEMIVTIGRPDSAERKFIKQAKKAGEPFPIKRVQLKLERAK